jgi:hypothetical protein
MRRAPDPDKGGAVADDRGKRGYGSNWKKWALIYLGVGVVVYLIIYLIISYD